MRSIANLIHFLEVRIRECENKLDIERRKREEIEAEIARIKLQLSIFTGGH